MANDDQPPSSRARAPPGSAAGAGPGSQGPNPGRADVEATRTVARTFDAWADAGRAEGMEQGHRRNAERVLAAQTWGAGDRVLDLGCGNGWAGAAAWARGAEVVAVDLAQAMLRKAAARGLPVARIDMAMLPFRDRTFSHAWSMEALYYASDPDAVLRDIRRVLSPGGQVTVLVDHFVENPDSHSWPHTVGVPMVLRSVPEWEAAFCVAGFVDVRAQRIGAAEDTLLLEGRRPAA